MNELDGLGFSKNSKLNELFKLLNQAIDEYNSKDKKQIDDYFKQFENNINHTLLPFQHLEGKEPSKIDKFTENGLNYEIKYYFLPDGTHYRTIDISGEESPEKTENFEEALNSIIHSPWLLNKISVDVNKKEEKTLEQMLKEAVEVEDYMLAAKIRDEIKLRKDLINDKVFAINEAIAAGDLELSEKLLAELRKITK